jgi:hypothetical protein
MSFEKLKSVLSTTGEHLGDLVWWTLSDAAIDRAALEAKWTTAGLPLDLLPEAPTAEKALKTAVREAALGQPDRLIRLGKETEQEVVFAVVREHRLSDGSVNYTQEAKLAMDRSSEAISSDQPSHDLVTLIRTAFTRLRATHSPDDIRRTVVRTLHSFAAVSLRDGGGIYWVPKTYAEKTRQLQSAVENIGSSTVYLLPVHDTADATRTLGTVAKGALEDELAGLQQEIQGFLLSPPDRPSTLVRRFDAFDALRMKAQLYKDILKVQVDDLDKQLSEMTNAVETLLQQKQAA